MIDTHCHLYSDELMPDWDQVIENAKKVGISHIFMPNIDSKSINAMLTVEEKYENCIAMMGLHPCSVKENYKDELKILDDWFSERQFCAVGETGIDLYWDKTYIDEQIYSFEYQIQLALTKDIPIIIHSRDSLDMTIEIISKHQNGKLTGIFHCFNGNINQADKIKDLGFYIGLGGVITYKNAKMEEIIIHNGLENVVLETDSPYLSPVPYRGKRNEPAYVKEILIKISEVLAIPIDVVETTTDKNANKIFKLNTPIGFDN